MVKVIGKTMKVAPRVRPWRLLGQQTQISAAETRPSLHPAKAPASWRAAGPMRQMSWVLITAPRGHLPGEEAGKQGPVQGSGPSQGEKRDFRLRHQTPKFQDPLPLAWMVPGTATRALASSFRGIFSPQGSAGSLLSANMQQLCHVRKGRGNGLRESCSCCAC